MSGNYTSGGSGLNIRDGNTDAKGYIVVNNDCNGYLIKAPFDNNVLRIVSNPVENLDLSTVSYVNTRINNIPVFNPLSYKLGDF